MSEIIKEPIEKYGLSQKDRPKNQFSKVGIIGCGDVGRNIARVISSHGIDVVMVDINEEHIDMGRKELEKELDQLIDHWGMTAGEKRLILSRIKGSANYNDLADCDLVLESIKSKSREDSVNVRKIIFKRIEEHVSPHTILATNASTIVITELSSDLEHKDRCVSLHISTTTPDANIVEVVRGLYTSQETYENVLKFVKLIDKIAIPVEESPGLISVRLFVSFINEACSVLMEGVGKMQDIDLTMRNGFGLPLGPFEMADKVGLDKIIKWMENLYDEYGDRKYKPSPLLKKLVRANQIGRHVGKGFYTYDDKGNKIASALLERKTYQI